MREFGALSEAIKTKTETGTPKTGTSGPDLNEPRFVREMGLEARIVNIVEPILLELGFRLVRVQLSQREGSTLQIMAERPDGSMPVSDCALASRAISAALDVDDPVDTAYNLEMSSPGIDRPLVRLSDFERWRGYECRVELEQMMDGRKRYRGFIESIEDGILNLAISGGDKNRAAVPVSAIAEAKLMLTDDLIEESLRRSKQSGIADQ
ncbi:MAG: ribosome maturation factor RimP [Rhizobiales bacterium]|nr:ribosome maturation factor RimP [Hyphomicrobiales bacterium]